MNDQNVTRIWYTINVVLGIMSVIMICEISLEIYKTPIEIVMQSFTHPICNFSFPAVAICNTNKFSKKRITHYASEISVKSNVSLENVIRYLSALGDLHDNVYDKNKNYAYIQTLIEKFGSNNFSTNTLFYILNILSTPCDELLINCVWKQQIHKCSKIFQWRFLDLGFCCVFNYHRKSFYNTFQVKDERQCISGWEEGLQVTIYNDVDDYFYNPTFELGATVSIFYPLNYPTTFGSDVQQLLIQIGTDNFINVLPSKTYSSEPIQAYTLQTRKCLFNFEKQTKYEDYSFGNCLNDCKLRYTVQECGCVPVQMPNLNNITRCSFTDLLCLSKIKDKLNVAMEIKLCTECLTDCDKTKYKIVHPYQIPLHMPHKNPGANKNLSIVRVYFENDHGHLYERNSAFAWFDIISNTGSILGIFLGVSVISIIKFIFIAISKLPKYIKTMF